MDNLRAYTPVRLLGSKVMIFNVYNPLVFIDWYLMIQMSISFIKTTQWNT